MPTNLKRVTVVMTPEVEALLDVAKKELYYNRSSSEMIRELILTGIQALEKEGKLPQSEADTHK